ncbi:hypothetical protein LOK49_LG10G01434 [Camellia lanceoleosa]|uniref:Uncharacterized protein n=1 Tax=Camellia lanceoleosa TaxID=1840588 RepID=A0ACC0GB86_9ERIC|nr:hypothetical protein LOK49_LG10G01434 [Camellia lanceoleosa]
MRSGESVASGVGLEVGGVDFDGEGVAVVCFDDDSAAAFGGEVATAAAAVVVVVILAAKRKIEVVVQRWLEVGEGG